jgi:hypothetical protein
MAHRRYQSRVLKSLYRHVREGRGGTLTVLFPRQSGKNHVSASLIASLLLDHAGSGGTIVVCAPTLQPQAHISYDRTLERLRLALRGSGRSPAASRWTIHVGRAAAIFLSASPEAHVAGHTASILLVGDEAQDIEEAWFDRQFRPMTASTGAPVVLFGTPWDGECLLDRAVANNRSQHPERHLQVSWQEVAAIVPRYGAFVREERERVGPGSQVFRTQYELLAGQPGDALFAGGRLESVRGEHPALASPLPGERYVAGLDVGGDGEGADATVLTIGRVAGARLEVVMHRAWHAVSFARLAADLRALHVAWGFARIEVDATGIGAALATMLEEEPALPVHRFIFGAASKHALGSGLIAAAESGRLAIYATNGSREYEACMAELRTCRAWQRPGGLIGWGARSGHDDYVASLALCLHAALAMPQPRMAVGRGR